MFDAEQILSALFSRRRVMMIRRATGVLLAALVIAAAGCRREAAKPGELTPAQKREMDALVARLTDEEREGYLGAAAWTLCHCATEEGNRRAGKVFEVIGEYVNGKPAAAAALGGAKGIRKGFRELLRDPDPVVRGFAAMALAVFDDRESKSEIARLLKPDPSLKNEPSVEYFARFDRSRAAMALGMMGAAEYAADLAALLKSEDGDVRMGAAQGLGHLKARAYVKEIAALLRDDHDKARAAAAGALAELGAREYAKDIAGLLEASGDSMVYESALRALVQHKAKGQVPEIAKLLGEEFRRDEACKALALLGVSEHAKEIAGLLDSPSPQTRMAALMSLGILNAREYEKQVAEHLQDREEYVRPDAALALVLMGSKEHAREATEAFEKERDYLLSYQRCRIPLEELRKLRSRADANLKVLRREMGKP